jgi:glycosyltransferase involved in cell wall biosynthesis
MPDLYKAPATRGPVLLVDWNINGHHLTYTRLYARALRELGVAVAVLCGQPEAIDTTQVALEGLYRAHYRRPWPQPLRFMLNHRAFKRNFRNAVAACEAKLKRRCALLFFNCMYAHEHETLAMLAEMSGLPWSGLLLHKPPVSTGKNSTGLQQLLAHCRLKTYGTLDETYVAREKNTARPPIFFPDLADDTFDPSHPAIRELRDFARGRQLVLAIGHLKASKGVAALVETALKPEADGYAFAFIGNMTWPEYTGEEKRLIDSAIGKAKNCLFKFGHISDGAHYNAYIDAADILYAAYRDFPHSSNTLTKAAIFKKPVIVSEGHLMALRTREYGMGEIVPQDDPDAILRAICRISGARAQWEDPARTGWMEYRALHSFETLKKSLAQLLEAYGI